MADFERRFLLWAFLQGCILLQFLLWWSVMGVLCVFAAFMIDEPSESGTQKLWDISSVEWEFTSASQGHLQRAGK